jgi:hypothetical protein
MSASNKRSGNLSQNNRLWAGEGWNSSGLAQSASSFCTWLAPRFGVATKTGDLPTLQARICASLVLYGRCQASSRPHARSRKGESRRILSEPFSPFDSKFV